MNAFRAAAFRRKCFRCVFPRIVSEPISAARSSEFGNFVRPRGRTSDKPGVFDRTWTIVENNSCTNKARTCEYYYDTLAKRRLRVRETYRRRKFGVISGGREGFCSQTVFITIIFHVSIFNRLYITRSNTPLGGKNEYLNTYCFRNKYLSAYYFQLWENDFF